MVDSSCILSSGTFYLLPTLSVTKIFHDQLPWSFQEDAQDPGRACITPLRELRQQSSVSGLQEFPCVPNWPQWDGAAQMVTRAHRKLPLYSPLPTIRNWVTKPPLYHY